jgi:hypothetical protein
MKTRAAISAATIMALLAGVVLHARDFKPNDQNNITVFLEYEPASGRDFYAASRIAAKMFDAAGVRLAWHLGEPSTRQLEQDRSIVVRTSLGAPASERPRALAYALPYQGMRIVIFYDRIQAFHPERRVVVLAHVLVHEITHILQGSTRHSRTGVMMASWTAKEYFEMLQKPLPFTEEDVVLIRLGLASRCSRVCLETSAE